MPSLGKPLTRPDGHLKVTGQARYSAEFDLHDLCHAALVESAIGRGRVQGIDTAAARQAPGVIAIFTHENTPRLMPAPEKLGESLLQGEGGLGETTWPLQGPEIYFAGQPLAVVVADTLEHARFAAELVRATYVTETPQVALAGAPTFKPETFGGSPEEKLQVERGAAQAALQTAPVKVEQVYRVPVEHHNPIEQLGTIATWSGDKLTLYDTSRNLDGLKAVVANAFSLPPDNVRCVCHYVGGAFGAKGFLWAPAVLTALAARQVKRPVKLEVRRQEMFHNAGQRPHDEQTVRIGAARDGKISAIVHATRTHTSPISGFSDPSGRPTKMLYTCDNLTISHDVARLNLPTACPMRAPGEATGMFALESALDELSYELGLDPIELRLRNYAEKDPENGKPWSSKNLRECYRQGAEKFGWTRRNPKPGLTRQGRYLVGQGMATTMYPGARRKASARVTFHDDGRAVFQSAAHDQGNGAYTVLRQIAADAVGLPIEQVTYELGDTAYPDSPPAGGSVTTASVGSAATQAAQNLRTQLVALAQTDGKSPLRGANATDVDARDGYLFLRSDPTKRQRHTDILKQARRHDLTAEAETEPSPEQKEYSIYSFGAIFAEVRVDADLGTVRVARLTGVYDVGRVLNPKTAHSQFMGGLLMGLGQALMEETLYDARSGRAIIRNLNDYHIATQTDTPVFEVSWLDIPDTHLDPMGARGLGEIGVVSTAAAIANAVYHATGKRVRDLPIMPDKLV